ncbi:STAS domain-containing protein [Celerinatantimonas yamalensis]|uniref:STAS domain-containing protein n=1 Tax=Celerinatantimonas yamalensis TaxID=559956 RepID=A0ABW9G4N5_9GAMM
MTDFVHHQILPESVTVYDVPELSQQWINSQKWQSNWQFDATATHEIDSCGLQLLLYLNQCLQQRGYQLSLVGVTGELLNALQLTSLDSFIVPAQEHNNE